MTYFRFLLIFIAPPILALAFLLALRTWRERLRRQPRAATAGSAGWVSPALLAVLVVVATLYTTPWDNHLIASHVWSYNRELVSGVRLGWIPLEELLFFPLQTLLVALWFLWVAPLLVSPVAIPAASAGSSGKARRVRFLVIACAGCLWGVAVIVLLVGWQKGTYLSWEAAWALPPLLLQLAVGADTLWRERRLLIATIAPAMLYLCAADAIAIHMGIWTIAPHQSLGLLIGGTLPLEEVVFFLLTTTLITVGLYLGRSVAASERLRVPLSKLHHLSPQR